MKKEIVLIVLILIAVVSISGCINSPIDNINNRMKDINTDILISTDSSDVPILL